MQPWRQYIYIMEVVLVATPVVPFMFFTGVALGMLATKETIVALKILPFWFGGCLGTFALWSMCVRIYQFRSIRTFKELPYVTLGYGVFSNTMLIFYLDI